MLTHCLVLLGVHASGSWDATREIELPKVSTAARRLAGSAPSEITISAFGLQKSTKVLSEALMLEAIAAHVNADPELLPNTTLRGLGLSEGLSDNQFFTQVDYAYQTEKSCLSFGVIANWKQDLMGPMMAARNSNHGFFMDTVLGQGKPADDFGTSFGLYGWSQLVDRMLDMAMEVGLRRFANFLPKSFGGLAYQMRFSATRRDIAIVYETIYDPSEYKADLSFEEADAYALNIVNNIVATKGTVMFFCYCSTNSIDFRAQVIRQSWNHGLFNKGKQWFTHYGSVILFKEPFLQTPQYTDLLPVVDHMKVMDFAGFEPKEYGVGSSADTAWFDTLLNQQIARFNMSKVDRGWDTLRWLNCDTTHAGFTLCAGKPGAPGTKLLQMDVGLMVVNSLHKIIYDEKKFDFCDVEDGVRTGDPKHFLDTLKDEIVVDGLSGFQQWQHLQLVGGTALSLARTWMANDWLAMENYYEDEKALIPRAAPQKYKMTKRSDMYVHRSEVVDGASGRKRVEHKIFSTSGPETDKPIEEVIWTAGVVGTMPMDWYRGMCGMTAKVNLDVVAKPCVDCAMYQFNPLDDPEDCVVINQFHCPPGTVMNSAKIGAGVEPCTSCPAGFFSPGGPFNKNKNCLPCAYGGFSAERAGECTACPASYTTLSTGAMSANACTCAKGTFWNMRDDVCESCPNEAFCPGGLHLPVTYKNTYGLYKGTLDTYKKGLVSKLAGSYDKRQNTHSFHKMEVFWCASSSHCPADEVTFPMSMFNVPDIVSDLPVRKGAPLANACPDRREGLACFRCKEGWYGTKGCTECSGGATGVNVIVFIILPFVMMCIYRGTTSSGTQRVQTMFVLVSTVGMASFFMQTIAVLDGLSVRWPIQFSFLFDISKLFMFDLGGFSLACMHGNAFAGKYWASIVIPIALVGFTVCGFVISNVLPLPDQWKMKVNHTISMVGMLLSALYVTLVKIVVAWFECPSNPNGPATLAKYKDVICDSDEHAATTGAMVIGLMLYVVGMYLFFFHAAVVAPAKWMDVTFRERWKFMLARWRPDVWFWGIVMLSRNLLVALSGIVSMDARVQLVYAAFVVILALSVTAIWQPWRATILNHYDVLSSLVLVLIAMFGLIFVALANEIELNKRLLLWDVAEAKIDLRTAFGTWLLALIGVFAVLFLMVIGWAVMFMIPTKAQQAAQEHASVCQQLSEDLKKCVHNENFFKEAQRLITDSTAYDRGGLQNFLNKITADQNSNKSGQTDTISINRAKEQAGK